MTSKRSRLAAVGLLAGVFAVGALAGGVGISAAGDHGPSRHRHGGPDEYVERLTTELDLSAVQQDSIQAVLARYEPAFDSIWRELRPRFDSLRTDVRAAIRAQLSSEQQRGYAEMLERDRADRARRTDDRKNRKN